MAALSRSVIGGLANDTRGQQTAASLLLQQAQARQAQSQVEDQDLARQAQELFGKSYTQLTQGGPQLPISPQPGQPSVPMGPPQAAAGAPSPGSAGPGMPPPGLATSGAPPNAGGPPAPPMPAGPGAPVGGPAGPSMPQGGTPGAPGMPGGPAGGAPLMSAPSGLPSWMSPQTGNAVQQALATKPEASVIPKPATALSWDQVMQTVQQMAPNASGRLLANVVQQYAPIIQQQQTAQWDRAKLQLQLGEQDQAHADRLLSYMQTAEERYAVATLHSQDMQASLAERGQAAKDAIDARTQIAQGQQQLQALIEQGRNDRAAQAEAGKNNRADARNATSIQRQSMVDDTRQAIAPLPLNPADKMAFQKLQSEHQGAEADYRAALTIGNSKAASDAQQRAANATSQLQDFGDLMKQKYPASAPAAPAMPAAAPPAPGGGSISPAPADPAQRVVGKKYTGAGGAVAIWTGKGWQPVQ